MAETPVRVLRDVTLVSVAPDPAYDPPWPGAGIWKVTVNDPEPGEDPVPGDT